MSSMGMGKVNVLYRIYAWFYLEMVYSDYIY